MNILNGLSVNYSFMYNSVHFQFFSPRFDRDKGLFPAREMRVLFIKKIMIL